MSQELDQEEELSDEILEDDGDVLVDTPDAQADDYTEELGDEEIALADFFFDEEDEGRF